MARKTIVLCDDCGGEIEHGKEALMWLTFVDSRRTSREAYLCDGCAGKAPGRTVPRRGPKAAART